MKHNLENKTALITGGGSGIGQAIACRLAELGVVVVLVGRRKEKLEETKQMIAKQGGVSHAVSGDITDINFRRSCIEKTIEITGGLDFLINNAGIALSCPLEETNEEQYDSIMEINAKAPYFLCQDAIEVLRKSDVATIINISSVCGHEGYIYQSAYSASKHALSGFTKSLAKELQSDDIRVHMISSGGVFTDMIKTARPDLKSDGLILPDDIAETVIYFLKLRQTNTVVDEIRLHRAGKEPF